MNNLKIKVCGMTLVEQIDELGKLNIDFVGFIFYEKSPRYVLNNLSKEEIKNIKGSFKKVALFVNETEENILQITDDCKFDFVQLHGNESPEFCKNISLKLPVIKAFSMREEKNIQAELDNYKSYVDYFLFDTPTKKYGGSGKKFDWNMLNNLRVEKPYFLSGGISIDDVENIHSLTKTEAGKQLFSLDINSKFEISPGIKNLLLIEDFLQRIKNIVR